MFGTAQPSPVTQSERRGGLGLSDRSASFWPVREERIDDEREERKGRESKKRGEGRYRREEEMKKEVRKR